MRAPACWLMFVLFCGTGSGLRAAEISGSAPSEKATIDPQWLRDLKSDEFRVREDACGQIARAGVDAIEPLRQAAESMDRESAARCLGVLERLSRDPAAETARLAKEALTQLESSTNPAVAEMARAALVKTEKLPTPSAMHFRVAPVAQFNIQLQVNGRHRKSTRIANGQRTVTLEENGRKTVVRDTDGKDIVVEVTETVNGVEKTTEYRGADAADLRQKSPAGADIYDNAVNGAGGNALNRAGVLLPGAVPLNADIEKRRADFLAESQRRREASKEFFDATRAFMELQREGKQGTPEFEKAETRASKAREAMKLKK
jgi:hypothetical protein